MRTQTMRGGAYATLAALIWGMFPLFVAFLSPAGAVEIVATRALFAALILALVKLLFPRLAGGFDEVRAVLARREVRWSFVFTCILICLNWGVFVHAVLVGSVFDAALGYYVYPLVVALLGTVVLGERIDMWGWVALGVVGAGVATKALGGAGMPWIALVIALTFGMYGVVRKRLGVNPVKGMFIETALLAPFALGILFWIGAGEGELFITRSWTNLGLGVMAGLITVAPLILYHAGNRDLPIIMAGLLFYVNPTTQVLVGIFYFALPIGLREWTVFALIWLGLALYFSTRRRTRQASAEARRERP